MCMDNIPYFSGVLQIFRVGVLVAALILAIILGVYGYFIGQAMIGLFWGFVIFSLGVAGYQLFPPILAREARCCCDGRRHVRGRAQAARAYRCDRDAPVTRACYPVELERLGACAASAGAGSDQASGGCGRSGGCALAGKRSDIQSGQPRTGLV